MKNTVLKPIVITACLTLAATAPARAETFTGKMAVTAASSSCPASLADGAKALRVSVVLPEGSAVVPGMSMTGEIRDFAVAGCTVSFAGDGGLAALTTSSLMRADGAVRLGRGCRGFCGL